MAPKSQPAPENGPRRAAPAWRTGLAALVLAGAGWAAYQNALSAPFVFDDIPGIVQHPAMTAFRAVGEGVPAPSNGTGVDGRPVVLGSLLLNQALGGTDVWGYHVFNVLVHLAAGLVLFGVVRRTLRLAGGRPDVNDLTAFMVALLWTVHPLQTESVTCVIQRTESLAGLFYLLTLYGFVRWTGGGAGNRRWAVLTVGACLVGAATKEILATAPVVILLWDRAFVAGTFAAAWRTRGRMYLALMAGWLVVAGSVVLSRVRGGAVGFGQGVTAWEYALTQCRALVLYLKLTVWPHPLVLDYGTDVVRDPRAVWWQGVAVLGLLALTAWALVRRPRLGFVGAWFFGILAPSSSFVPLVTQTMAEHRMYLPLAAPLMLAVFGVRRVAGRWALAGGVAFAVALGVVTVRRNADYATAEGIWRDNLAKWPANIRPHRALAQLAEAAGRPEEVIVHDTAAVRARPDDATAHFNLAVSLVKAGRVDEGIAHYEEAIRLKPTSADAHINLASVWLVRGRHAEAVAHAEAALRLKSGAADVSFNLAQVYFFSGRVADALPHYQAAVRLNPASTESHYRLGHACVRLERFAEAAAAFREAVAREPGHFEAHANLAGALMSLGRTAEAVPVYEAALRLKPGDPLMTANLALARAQAAR